MPVQPVVVHLFLAIGETGLAVRASHLRQRGGQTGPKHGQPDGTVFCKSVIYCILYSTLCIIFNNCIKCNVTFTVNGNIMTEIALFKFSLRFQTKF